MANKNLLGLTKEDASLWHRRIRVARRRRETQFARKARRMMERYKGVWADEDLDLDALNSDFIITNLTHADVKILRSIVLNRNPIVRVESLRPEDVDAEALNEAVLNAEWLKIGVKDELDLSAAWAIITSEGYCKTGYQADIGVISRKRTVLDEHGEQVLVEPGKISVETGEETITSESAYVVCVNPMEVLTAPGATRMKNLRWIVQEMYRPRGDTMSDDNFTRTVRRKVPPAARVPKRYQDTDLDMSDETTPAHVDHWKEEYSRELHIWDRRRQMYCVLAEGIEDDWLMSEPMNVKWPSKDELPFTRLYFNDVPGEWWCISDIEPTEGMEHDLNLTTTYQLAGAKRAARHWRVNPGSAQRLKDQFANLQDGDVLEYADGEAEQIETKPLGHEVFAGAQTTMTYIREVRGINEYYRQGAPMAVNTATEASLVQAGTQLANNPRREHIEEAASDIARKLRMCIISHYEEEHVTRMVGSPTAKAWAEWVGRDLEGEYRLFIEVGSSFPIDKAQEQQKRMAIYKIAATSQAAPDIDQQKMLRWLFDAFDVSLDRFLLPAEMREKIHAEMQAAAQRQAQMEEYGIAKGKMKQEEASGMGDNQLPNAAAPITGTSGRSRTGEQ